MLGYIVIGLIAAWIALFLWVRYLRHREQRRREERQAARQTGRQEGREGRPIRRGRERPSAPAGPTPPALNLVPISVKVGITQRVAYWEPPKNAEALPLLLCFHGGLGNPERFAETSDFAARALAFGFLAVFPGAPDGWVDGRPERGTSTEDLDFAVALVEQLAAKNVIDPVRVYGVGSSNGGFFVQHLATERPGLLAGGASVLASLPTAVAESTANGPPMPFVLACDSGDSIMPFAGGEIVSGPGLGVGGWVIPTPSARSIWVARNGAGTASAPKRVEGPIGFWADVYDHPAGLEGAPVRFVEIQGLGHHWPRWPGIGGAPSVNVADIVLEFFASAPVQKFAAREDRPDFWLQDVETGMGYE
jgi:polyhydroxybutyrate depolymerase